MSRRSDLIIEMHIRGKAPPEIAHRLKCTDRYVREVIAKGGAGISAVRRKYDTACYGAGDAEAARAARRAAYAKAIADGLTRAQAQSRAGSAYANVMRQTGAVNRKAT